MFFLDDEISKWCSALMRQGHVSASDVEELRDHLYSEVQEQQALGANEEEAFRAAIEKLGTMDELSREYSKNRRIGHALSVIANVPFGRQVLGSYLMVVTCLMIYSTVSAYYAYLSGRLTPPDTFPFLLALVFVAAFGWQGFKGYQLLRGRAPSYGALLGLLALLLIQIPIVGGQPDNGYEVSAGLQYAVLFGPVEDHFAFNLRSVVHVNSPTSEAYLGVNMSALLAALFIAASFFDKWRKDEALTGDPAAA